MYWRELGGVSGLESGLGMADVGSTDTGHRDTQFTDLVGGVALQIKIVLERNVLRGRQSDCRREEHADSPPFTEPSHSHGNLRIYDLSAGQKHMHSALKPQYAHLTI